MTVRVRDDDVRGGVGEGEHEPDPRKRSYKEQLAKCNVPNLQSMHTAPSSLPVHNLPLHPVWSPTFMKVTSWLLALGFPGPELGARRRPASLRRGTTAL